MKETNKLNEFISLKSFSNILHQDENKEINIKTDLVLGQLSAFFFFFLALVTVEATLRFMKGLSLL